VFDLVEMKRMFANSIRVYLPIASPSLMERLEFIVSKAEELDLRLFVQVITNELNHNREDESLTQTAFDPITKTQEHTNTINFANPKARTVMILFDCAITHYLINEILTPF